jgi:hypothetical protein
MAQSKLGTACAHLELAPIEASPQVDDREFFVATWCLDPRLIPEEKTIFVPEPNVRVPGNALFLDADEIVLNKLPGLRYLVQIRVVEYQDWSTPPPLSLDDGREFRRDDDSGSGDSNYNRRHPGLDDRGGRPRGPGFRSYRLAGNDDAAPSLGGHREPTFPPHGDCGRVRMPARWPTPRFCASRGTACHCAANRQPGEHLGVLQGYGRMRPRRQRRTSDVLCGVRPSWLRRIRPGRRHVSFRAPRGTPAPSATATRIPDFDDDVAFIDRQFTDEEAHGFIRFAMGMDPSRLENAPLRRHQGLGDCTPDVLLLKGSGPRPHSPHRPGFDLGIS